MRTIQGDKCCQSVTVTDSSCMNSRWGRLNAPPCWKAATLLMLIFPHALFRVALRGSTCTTQRLCVQGWVLDSSADSRHDNNTMLTAATKTEVYFHFIPRKSSSAVIVSIQKNGEKSINKKNERHVFFLFWNWAKWHPMLFPPISTVGYDGCCVFTFGLSIIWQEMTRFSSSRMNEFLLYT